VDSTILDVKLAHGFKFGQMSQSEGNKFSSALEKLPKYLTVEKLFLRYHCLDPKLKKYFFLKNLFKCTKTDGIPPELTEFDNKLFLSYLDPTLSLMRLFKEGNINMPIKYYFTKNPLSPFIRGSRPRYSYPELFSLKKEELKDLHNFLKRHTLPFSHTYLQLAFENFEISYEIANQSLAFVALMNGLEALFNPGGGEITHRISRNCAVLLGSDVKDSRKICKDVKYLYELRCKIVHARRKVRVERDDLKRLRDYVRRALRIILDLNKPKSEALKTLNEMGFGEFQNFTSKRKDKD